MGYFFLLCLKSVILPPLAFTGFSRESSKILENSWDWLGNHMINKKTLKVVVFFFLFHF